MGASCLTGIYILPYICMQLMPNKFIKKMKENISDSVFNSSVNIIKHSTVTWVHNNQECSIIDQN